MVARALVERGYELFLQCCYVVVRCLLTGPSQMSPPSNLCNILVSKYGSEYVNGIFDVVVVVNSGENPKLHTFTFMHMVYMLLFKET